MRRAAAVLALALLLVPALAHAQRSLPVDGITGGGTAGGFISNATSSRFTLTYGFTGQLGAPTTGGFADIGWAYTASTGAVSGTQFGISTPALHFSLDNCQTYARLWEIGYMRMGLSQKKNGEYKVAVNWAQFAGTGLTADTEVVQFMVGDTSFVKFQKRPDGLGIIFVGSDHVGACDTFCPIPASWPKDTWIGYVGNGSDTTYVPLGPEPGDLQTKFYIYAAPDNGPVQFYMDDVLKATISDVTRSNTVDNRGISIMGVGGENTNPECYIGPVSIERAW